ncbi:MAG: hypothetical protein AAGG53_10040 [Cyanobacteria bacterium P01_H01_bin.152]
MIKLGEGGEWAIARFQLNLRSHFLAQPRSHPPTQTRSLPIAQRSGFAIAIAPPASQLNQKKTSKQRCAARSRAAQT